MTTPTIIEVDERGNLPSASRMDRIAHCAACLKREEGLAGLPQKDGTADAGNAVHLAMETGDSEWLDVSEADIKRGLDELEQTAVKNWEAEFNLDSSKTQVWREKRFWIHNRQLIPVASAKLDVVRINGPYALVTDYKTGFKHPTPSEKNWQLKTQAVSVFQEHADLEHIRVSIAHSRMVSRWDAADYTQDDLRGAEWEILSVLRRAEDPHAIANPGPHCRWCRAQGMCRENAIYNMMGSDTLPVVTGGRSKVDALKKLDLAEAVARMTPDEMATVWKRKNTVETMFETLEHRLKSLPEAQLNELGYKLVPGVKRYDVPNERISECYTKLQQVLSDAEILSCMKMTRGSVDKLVAEKKGLSGDQAKAFVIELLGLECTEGEKRLKAI